MPSRNQRRAHLAMRRTRELSETIADCMLHDRHLGGSSEIPQRAYTVAHVLAGANEDDTPKVASKMLEGIVDGLCDYHERETVVALLRKAIADLESEVG